MNDQIRELNKPPIRLIERILEKFVTAILETVRDECIEANNRISALEAELAACRKALAKVGPYYIPATCVGDDEAMAVYAAIDKASKGEGDKC